MSIGPGKPALVFTLQGLGDAELYTAADDGAVRLTLAVAGGLARIAKTIRVHPDHAQALGELLIAQAHLARTLRG